MPLKKIKSLANDDQLWRLNRCQTECALLTRVWKMEQKNSIQSVDVCQLFDVTKNIFVCMFFRCCCCWELIRRGTFELRGIFYVGKEGDSAEICKAISQLSHFKENSKRKKTLIFTHNFSSSNSAMYYVYYSSVNDVSYQWRFQLNYHLEERERKKNINYCWANEQ